MLIAPVLAAEFTWNAAWLGAVEGLVYGLLALGIVLVYRSTRVINFAVADLGAPSAFLVALCVLNYGWPYWAALVSAVAVGAGAGVIVEIGVIRRLFSAPRVILLVATVGVAQLATAVTLSMPELNGGLTTAYPTALGGRWEPFLDIQASGPQVVILVVVPVLAGLLGYVMNHTRFGRHVKASATNADLARLSGVNPKLVSTGVWAIAGFLSALSATLLLANGPGTAGLSTGQATAGPRTLLFALTAALLAGMRSFPRAVLAGALIGITKSYITFNFDESEITQMLMLVVTLVAVAVVGRRAGEGGESFSFAPRVDVIPERLRQTWWAGRLARLVGLAALMVAALAPLVFDQPSRQLTWSTVIGFAVCATSVSMLTGWGGQLSLAQMGFAGLGAFGASSLQNGAGPPFVLCLLGGALIAAAAAFVVGLGALRVRGLLLSVSTLAFAVAASQYLFRRSILSGSGSSSSAPLRRGSLGPIDLADKQRNYYWFALAVLVAVTIVASRIRRSGVGRSIIGVRENENAAAAMTVSPTRTKLLVFTLAGFIAGLGGALLGGLVVNVPFTERFFLPADSLRLVAMTVIGGLGSLAGPIIGALWVVGMPFFFPDNELVPLFTSSIGLLILLLYLPGGLVQLGYVVRRFLFRRSESRRPPAPTKTRVSAPATIRRVDTDSTHGPGPVLATRDVTVRFGGLAAVDGVSLAVHPGEVLGLIGTNGAGKSTLLNAIGGFVASTGRVELLGRDVTRIDPAGRARRGLGRTFQAATLYPELTVRETVQLALEARRRTSVVGTLVAWPPTNAAERAKRAEAGELIDFLGLGRYGDRFVAELSTGTRRIVELAAVLAVWPRVLCLDEPTAGVAQREAEAFGPLIMSIRAELGASLVIVEHDMPLIMSISDRVVCLETGHVIAEGTPEEVRNNPSVVASYLGTDSRAIDRSSAV